MADLIERLEAEADRRRGDPADPSCVSANDYEMQALLREAAAAIEAAREDGERLDYVMRHVRGSELRRMGIHTNGGDHRPAIDQARGKAGQEV